MNIEEQPAPIERLWSDFSYALKAKNIGTMTIIDVIHVCKDWRQNVNTKDRQCLSQIRLSLNIYKQIKLKY